MALASRRGREVDSEKSTGGVISADAPPQPRSTSRRTAPTAMASVSTSAPSMLAEQPSMKAGSPRPWIARSAAAVSTCAMRRRRRPS